jgi:hypothetical protein
MLFTPDSLISDIEGFTLTKRSLQKEIGVSEIGMSCRRCVARKLAKYEKAQVVSSFRTTIGRYFHEGVAEDLKLKYPDDDDLKVEDGLFVHQYKDFVLKGSCDVFAPNEGNGLVLDWKCVGDDTLELMRKARDRGELPKQQYVVQGHLYGLGWELKGYAVRDICIQFVPANKGDLRRYAVAFQYRYDRAAAAKALMEVELLIDAAEIAGWDAVVRGQTPERGCLSCAAYTHVDDPVFDLMFNEKREKRMQEYGIR